MEITIKNEIDPGRICRACLSSENSLREMLESDEDYEYFLDAYKTCTSVDLKEIPDLPLHVCDSCLIRIEEFNTFREMCLKSHDIIQTLVVNDSKNDIKINEVEEIKVDSVDNFFVDPVDIENVGCSVDVQSNNASDTETAENMEYASEDFNIKESFTCEICFETLNDLKTFSQHHETMHSTKDYKCAFCEEAFNHPALLTRHIKVHKNEISIAHEKMYQCGRCEKTYKTMLNLQIHVYSHTGLRPYKCEDCPKAFTKQSALLSHRKIHSGVHSYLCTECGKGFNCELLLKRHRAMHLGLRPFKCKFCPNSFVSPGDLRIHVRIHTGEKPYLCSTCGKSFSRTNHLKVHKRTHTGEKPYECSFCGKCFSQSGDRNVHERIHTGSQPHICTVCDKRFNHSTALTIHKRTHQKNSYTCKTCGKHFLKLGAFENHLRIHLSEDEKDDSPEPSIIIYTPEVDC